MAAVLCRGCRRGITGPSLRALGASWHPGCFVCGGCGRPLEGAFVDRAGRGWHPACHGEAFGPRCAVCGAAITGAFLANALDQKICARHGTARACFSCGRWLDEVGQAQALYAPYGTPLCGRCRPGLVDPAALGRYGNAFGAAALGELGLALAAQPEVPIRLETLEALRRLQNPVQAQAEGLTQTYVDSAGGRGIRAIVVAGGLAREHFEGVLAHEFGHAWLFREARGDLPEAAAEGFCELVRHQWLARLDTPLAAELRERLASNPDPIYGGGFRRNRLSWDRDGLPGVLDLLH